MPKTVKRDVPGHFLNPGDIGFFIHVDIVSDWVTDARTETDFFCVSLIGEYAQGWDNLNASGKTYELCVFDRRNGILSENAWMSIDGLNTSDKDEAVQKHAELVKKYLEIARANSKEVQ